MPRHYLDHASTSPPRPEAVAAMERWLRHPAGDPARLHEEGRLARQAVEEAREQVAAWAGTRPRQVVFTSGATEAVNAAVWGATAARPGRPVVLAEVEHAAVRQASARAAPVVTVPVDGDGRLRTGTLAEALAGPGAGAALVHCQLVNHEVGTLQPVAEVAACARAAGALLHVDAAAGAGLVAWTFDDLGADLVSVSAHKLGGPGGVGALLVRRGLRLEPLVVGGEQERARRAGMENVAAVVGFGAACASLAVAGRRAVEADGARAATDALAEAALAVDGVRRLGPTHERAPHIVCLALEGVEAEPVLLGLDRAGVAAHSGSACAAEGLAPSPVLAAMGVDAERSLRLSVGWTTGPADVAAFAACFGPVVARLRALGAAP